MALFYLDTSALAKLYVDEPGTERMLRLADPAHKNRFAVLGLARVEFRSAVRRRERMGEISADLARSLPGQLQYHLESLYLLQPVTEAVLEEACALIDRHTLRAYDAIQLAGCLILRAGGQREPPTFVCADRELLRAAEHEGLTVFDPDPPR